MTDFKPGYINTTPVLCKSSQTKTGRKIVDHEYANTDKRYAQDMGKIARTFEIAFWVSGNDFNGYAESRDSLLLELEREGQKTFINPWVGTLFGKFGETSIDESQSQFLKAEVTTTFYESVEDPSAVRPTSGDADYFLMVSEGAKSQLIANELGGAFLDAMPSIVAVFFLPRWGAFLVGLLAQLTSQLSRVGNGVKPSTVNLINSLATNNVAPVTGKSFVWTSVSSLIEDLNGYSEISMSDFSELNFTLIDDLPEIPSNLSSEGLASYLRLYGPLKALVFFNQASITILQNYFTEVDVNKARIKVLSLWSGLNPYFKFLTPESVSLLQQCNANTLDYLLGLQPLVYEIVPLENPPSMPLLVHTYEHYDSTDLYENLIALNDVADPLYLPDSTKRFD
jgi:hypothetical protein